MPPNQNPTYGTGRLLSQVEVVAVFVSGVDGHGVTENWHDLSDPEGFVREVCLIDAFLADLVDSAYMDLLGAEYSVEGGPPIGRGTFLGSFFPSLRAQIPQGGVVDDAELRRVLSESVSAGEVPPPSPDTLYMLLTQFDITADGRTTNRPPPAGMGGYHKDFTTLTGQHICYSAVAFPTTAPPDTTLTYYLSHELAEAVTDPVNHEGWADRGAVGQPEICDGCGVADPATDAMFHSWAVSRFWSRSEQRCVVPEEDGRREPGPQASITLTAGSTCFGDVVAGEPATFAARATKHGRPGALDRYLWRPPAEAPAIGSIAMPHLTVRAPAAGVTFEVKLNSRDAIGCLVPEAARVQHTVTAEVARGQALICELINRIRVDVHVNMFVNPLWDPLRNLVTEPISDREMHAVTRLAYDLMQLNDLWTTQRDTTAGGVSDGGQSVSP